MLSKHDEMKEKGNECIRQKMYQEAAGYYAAALKDSPSSHTVYSNRSLAYSKLGKFDLALEDANKCIELVPNFARGYLRRSVALTGLGEYEVAMTAAEEGYKLRGSDTICHNCVTQWLEANEVLLKEKIEKCFREIGIQDGNRVIPKGCRIISDDCLTIFLNILLCRLQFTTTGVEVDFVNSCVLKLFEELDRILQLFGHIASACSREWLAALRLVSKVNPSTSRVPQEIIATLLEKSIEFSIWLDTAVDHALYPIVSPIMSLAMIAVNARCISLNVLNSDQHVVQVICQACLPFFQKPVLSGPNYIIQHIALYKELLESYGTSNYPFTEQETEFGRGWIKKLEALLKQCPVDEYSKEGCDKAKVSIALARIRLGENPGFDPVKYASKSGKAVSRVGRMDPEKLKAYVQKKQKWLTELALMEFSYEDAEDLLCCTGTLLEIGEKEMAIKAFQVAESGYLRLFQQQIANNVFSFDEAASALNIPETVVLQNASWFLGIDNKLVADIVMKWKCFYSEFRAILIRLGVGKRYVKTFQAIQQMRVGAKLNQDTLMQLAEQHQQEVNEFMEERGQFVLMCLLKQSYKQVQSVLRPDQLVLDYCIEREEATKDDDNGAIVPTGVLVVIQPQKELQVFPVDFRKVLLLARKWSKLLSNPQSLPEVQSVAKELCKLLFPSDIKILLDSPGVKHVFICPDAALTVLPLELLLFEDGKNLGEKCTLSYLSSSRELLRDQAIVSVSAAHVMIGKSEVAEEENGKKTENNSSEDVQSGSSRKDTLTSQTTTSIQEVSQNGGSSSSKLEEDDHSTVGSFQESALQAPIHKECIIVASPNFDLEKPTVEEESSIWKSVIQGFASLFSKPDVNPILSKLLPGTEEEATEVRQILTKSMNPIKVRHLIKDDATMTSVLKLKSPFILHFSTHGFSRPHPRGFRSSFWEDTTSGLLLAGSNTYTMGNFAKIVPEAGTGELSSLAACGMDLQGTRLVYLSTCVSSYGACSYGESISSLAQAFRSAGAQTVIAAQWVVHDDTARLFAVYFYEAACKTGVLPSQALSYAKQKIREETVYKHWGYWGGFVCIGENSPLFPQP